LKSYQERPLLVEWVTLQNQFDAFEKCSLAIKLVAILVTALLIFKVENPFIIVLLNGVFWTQDAIWKTVQSRFADRLLIIEGELLNSASNDHIQFNTAWAAKPRGFTVLVMEYFGHSVKPTVAFPHCVLVCVGVYMSFVV